MNTMNDLFQRLLGLVKLLISQKRDCRPFGRYRSIGRIR